ncbi:hypothetical protein NDU88_002396 [Pleurodeles waltl]|uniref:Uncharacterized protein n=1 Tax=Pleurodeles waltl TaxID=8319 RepID=A0AAV7P857_PLEWA|nr:hypothetical protein NDU88_002396 [Pleurodeles waltl]
MLKWDIVADIKDLKKEVIDLGHRVDSVEQTQDAREEELDCHRRELLTLQDKNQDLQYQIEDLENRSCRSNIRIKGIPAQAVAGSLEDFVVRLFRHVAPSLKEEDIVLDITHRAGRPDRAPGQADDILTCLHYFKQKERAQMAVPPVRQRSPGQDRLEPNNRQRTTHKPSTVERQKEKAALIRSLRSQDSVPEVDSDH